MWLTLYFFLLCVSFCLSFLNYTFGVYQQWGHDDGINLDFTKYPSNNSIREDPYKIFAEETEVCIYPKNGGAPHLYIYIFSRG